MIKESYVSYEIAKLLKEKGFDESSFAYYSEFDDWKILRFWRKYARNPINTFYLCAPTHQMACAWLRKVHNIFIEISTSIDFNGGYHFGYAILDKECKYVRYIDSDWDYEDAVEAALKYVLENLI